MIIVEGPDGGGKSHLAKSLSEWFEIPIAPRVVSKDTEAMVDLKKWVEDNVTLPYPGLMIYDRHRLISEPIYGPLLREAPESGFNDPIWMMQMMYRFYSRRPLIFYCIPPLETVLANLDGDEDNRVVAPKAQAIYSAYCAKMAADVAHTRMENVHHYDYTRNNFTAAISITKNHLGR